MNDRATRRRTWCIASTKIFPDGFSTHEVFPLHRFSTSAKTHPGSKNAKQQGGAPGVSLAQRTSVSHEPLYQLLRANYSPYAARDASYAVRARGAGLGAPGA